jgi:hypothetical protein
MTLEVWVSVDVLVLYIVGVLDEIGRMILVGNMVKPGVCLPLASVPISTQADKKRQIRTM